MNTIAIDPGITGGIAFIGDDVTVKPLPINATLETKIVKKKEKKIKKSIIDVTQLIVWFNQFKPDIIIIEDIFLPGNQGGNKTVGMNYGRIFAIAEFFGIPIETVRPQVWQKVMLPGIKGRDELKPAGIDKVNKLYPNILPKLGKTGRGKKYHDGCADAVLIGLWWKETNK